MWAPTASLHLPPLHRHAERCFSRELLFLWRDGTGQWPPASSSHQSGRQQCSSLPGTAAHPGSHLLEAQSVDQQLLSDMAQEFTRSKGKEEVDMWRKCSFSMRQETLLETQIATSSPPGLFPSPKGQSSFPYCFRLPMTSLFSFFLPKTERAAACEISLFSIQCGVLQEGVSAISPVLSLILQNLCFCISRTVFACRDAMLPCHTPYTILFLWHSVARVTEYRNSCSRGKQDRKREIFILSRHNFSKAPYRSFILSRCLHPSQLHKAHTHILRWFAELYHKTGVQVTACCRPSFKLQVLLWHSDIWKNIITGLTIYTHLTEYKQGVNALYQI